MTEQELLQKADAFIAARHHPQRIRQLCAQIPEKCSHIVGENQRSFVINHTASHQVPVYHCHIIRVCVPAISRRDHIQVRNGSDVL